jgi:hypothetical protein
MVWKVSTFSAVVCALAVGAGMGLLTRAVRADWVVGDPYKMHYPQLPDLTDMGLDVLATIQQQPVVNPQWKVLADDWKCTESGAVDDIHIWGSWLSDVLPNSMTGPSAGNVKIKLSIHSDVPANQGPEPLPYSRPGDQLWSHVFSPGDFTVVPYGTASPEAHFWDPNPTGGVIGHDWTVWQYNFNDIGSITAPFSQILNTIYWLDVQVMALDPAGFPDPSKAFGWKTTNPLVTQHFMDDAVFADTATFNGNLTNMWQPLSYPQGHPFYPQSIDFAFVITPEPASVGILGLGVLFLCRRGRKA